MNTMRKLTLHNLRRNRARTAVTVVGIMLSAALMTVVTGVVTSGQQTLVDAEVSHYGDWTVGMFGKFDDQTAAQLMNNRDVAAVYEETPVGLAKFEFKSAYKNFVNLVGMSENTYQNCYRCQLAEGHFPTSSDEILLTPQFVSYAKDTYHTGDTLTLTVGSRWNKGTTTKDTIHSFGGEQYMENYIGWYEEYKPEQEDFFADFTKTYTVAGVLKTASGNLESDSSAASIQLLTGVNYDASQRSKVYDGTAELRLRLKDSSEKNYIQVLGELTGLDKEQVQMWIDGDILGDNEALGKITQQLSQNPFGITDFFSNYSVLRCKLFAVSEITTQTLIRIAAVVLAIIIVSSVFIIRNSFAISITEKTKLYGMLSSVGATPRQIRHNVLFEGFLLGAVGIPLGIGLGIGVTAILMLICNVLLGDMLAGDSFSFHVSWIGVACAAVLSALTIFCSTYLTARRASKTAPVEAIRGVRDIKVKKKEKSYKTPRIIEKLFGIGGSIAYKNLKRSRKKYRATVISIVASVTMFLTMYSFVGYTFSYTARYTMHLNYNLSVTLNDEHPYETLDGIYSQIKQLDKVEDSAASLQCWGYQLSVSKGDIPEEMFAPDVYTVLYGNSLNYLDSKRVTFVAPIVCFDDANYRAILSSLGLQYDDVKDKGLIRNINTARLLKDGEPDPQGKETKGKLLKNPQGVEIKGKLISGEVDSPSYGSEFRLELAAALEDNEFVNHFTLGASLDEGTILVSEEWFKNNIDENFAAPYIELNSADANQTEQDISAIFAGSVSVLNHQRNVQIINSVTLVVEIFVYGFILVISLIGITNIFNTITTNMRLRSKEFAMLRSVGMTRREFNRMIRLESVFYTAKSLIIGIPLGLLGGWAIKLLFDRQNKMAYQFPWEAILISVAAVLLVVWLIMRFSIAKVQKQNIIETIRNENV